MTAGEAADRPTAVTDSLYDKNGNLLSKAEYDWVAHTGATIETPPATVRRLSVFSYYAGVPSATDTNTTSQNAYWQAHNPAHWTDPAGPRRLDALQRLEVYDAGALAKVTEFRYDDAYRNGNIEEEYQWDNTTGAATNPLTSANSIVFAREFDSSGNLTDIFEPAVRTHIEYDSAGNHPRYVYHAYQTPEQRRWEYIWSANGTVITAKTDLDNELFTTYTYDDLGRQTSMTEGKQTLTGTGLRRATTVYDDANRTVKVLRDLRALGDEQLQTLTTYDQLGRPILTQQSDGVPLSAQATGIQVQTIYRDLANTPRTAITSSPFRTTSDLTLQWTCTSYDRLGRVTAVATFTGSTAPANCDSTNQTSRTVTVHDADSITITDPTGRARKQARDALGRTVLVVEDPTVSGYTGLNYGTQYAYDALDNLRLVCQNGVIQNNACSGGQTRTFTYTSLGRLASAGNPESGLSAYTYDGAGNLKTRTDARNVVTTYSYDPLQRLTSKTYSSDPQNTPAAEYEYHLAGASTLGSIGQVQRASVVVGSTATTWTGYGYDRYGRLNSSLHSIDGYPSNLPFAYTYYLNDTIASLTYPSNHVVNYTVDDAGRPTLVATSQKTYADLAAAETPYLPDGRIAQLKLGNGLWDTRDYRPADATTSLTISTAATGGANLLQLDYNYHATQNNGNLLNHTIRAGGKVWKQSYNYDGVNRLRCAAELAVITPPADPQPPADPCTQGFWRQVFGYDPYGNLWVEQRPGLTGVDPHEPAVSTNFDAANRLWVNNSAYDAAGNQTRYEPWQLSYDAENRMIRAETTPNASNGTGTYSYDADGRRVKKTWTVDSTTHTTYYLYNALGQLATEYTTQAAISTGAAYLHTDLLGSVRMITGEKPPTGAAPILECYDYLPFGRMLNSADNGRNIGCHLSNPDTQIESRVAEKFTGKERDSETRLDFFETRYFSAAQGRFTSADSLIGKPEWLPDPQRWNRYAYVRNNPLKFIDPTGEDLIIYYSFSGDLDADELDFLKKNLNAILSGIKDKYTKAGVKNVELRDRASLRPDQLKKLNDASAKDKGIDGVFQLQFASETAWDSKSVAPLGLLGGTDNPAHLSAVYMGRFAKTPPKGCNDVCGLANVGAHEVGHAAGFQVIPAFSPLEDLRVLRGGAPDLMRDGQPQPDRPLLFNMARDKNIRAVEHLNRIGDNTPK